MLKSSHLYLWMLDDLRTLWGLCEYHPRTFSRLSNEFLRIFWGLTGTFWGLSEDFLRTSWGLANDFWKIFWGLPEDFLRTFWGLFGDFLRTFWILSEDFLRTFWIISKELSNDCLCLVNEIINEWCVCQTASATPGLLSIYGSFVGNQTCNSLKQYQIYDVLMGFKTTRWIFSFSAQVTWIKWPEYPHSKVGCDQLSKA